jgi:very-short-patch-repair endonuclease
MKQSDDPRVEKAIDEAMDRVREDAAVSLDYQMIQAPEMTPIEQIVFVFLKAKEQAFDQCRVFPQHHIGKYRVDFLVEEYDFYGRKSLGQFVIECDGHDFHEKTKEQAAKDKKRDRELQSLGLKVFHFTGSEIWRSNDWQDEIEMELARMYRERKNGKPAA